MFRQRLGRTRKLAMKNHIERQACQTAKDAICEENQETLFIIKI